MSMSHQRSLSILALVASLLVSVPSRAEPMACPNIEPLDLSSLLLAPPCDSCDITKAELVELQQLQKSRTPEMVKHASDDYTRTLDRFLGGIGIPTDAEKMASAQPLFACVAQITEDAVDKAKLKFNRTRPYNLPDNELQVLKAISPHDTSAYPSGHSAFGMVTGLILIETVPELRERILSRIEDFGFSRLISGVHFRSDVYAGEIAGALIAQALFADNGFRSQIEDAKPALRKAAGL